jgi:DNA-binding response OmpR family regulator
MTKVLVVDDDVEAAETLALMLEISGHDAHVAHDGRQAVDAWTSHRHPVVFLDLGLPDVDGFDVARTIRDSQDFDAPLVIALTGQGTDVVPMTRACGFDSYLQKPAAASALMAAMARVPESAQGTESPAQAGLGGLP